MRILVNALAAVRGGGATSLRPLVSALIAVDGGRHTYELIARSEIAAQADPGHPRVTAVGLKHRSLAERLYHEQVWLRRRAARGRPDVMLTISSPAVFAAPVPQAVMFRNALPFTPELLAKYGTVERARFATLRAVSVAAARFTEKVVFISKAQRELIAPHLHLPAERTACVYLGRSLEFNPAAREQAPATLDRYGIRPPYLLSVALFHSYKNLVELVEAFALAAPRLPAAVSLVLAGTHMEQAYTTAVRAAVDRAGLQDRVKLIGSVAHSDLPSLYAAASIFLFSSTCESFPNILIEALASGVPTLSSRLGPMPELAGEGAGYFDAYSPADIATQLVRLWDDPSEQRALGARGLARAESFSWEATARGLLGVLEEIAGARSREALSS